MEELVVDGERGPRCRMVIGENEGRRDDEKNLLRSKMWGVYMKEK